MYVRPKSIVFARHLLATCKQEAGEDVDQFLQKLRSLAKACEFKAVSPTEHCNESVRDALISGLYSNSIREKLLAEHDLNLDDAHKLARTLELAHKQSQSYSTNSNFSCSTSDTPTQSTQPTNLDPLSASIKQSCYFCGRARHPRVKCPAKDAVCRACGKTGHFQQVCRSKQHLNATSSSFGPILSTTLNAASPCSLSSAYAKITVNGVRLQALIDTGSSASYISLSVVQANNWSMNSEKSLVTMASTSLTCATIGYCLVSISYNDSVYEEFRLAVLPNLCTDVLLGHDFLGLHDKLEMSFGGKQGVFTLCGLTAANIESPPLFSNLSPDCRPIATKSRRHTPDDEAFIASEIQTMLKDGIIEPSTSPWRAQVLVTKNATHKKRMVVDYSQTINRFTYLDAYPLPRLDKMIEKISRYELYSTLDLKSAYHQVPILHEEKPYTAFEACGQLFQFCRIPFGVTNGVACFQRTIDRIIQLEGLHDTFAYIDNVTVCGSSQASHDMNLNAFLEAAKKYGLTFNESKSITASKEICLLGYQISKGVIKPDPERMEPIRALQPPQDMKAQQRIIGMFAYYSQWIPRFSDKISPLTTNKTFPVPEDVRDAFTHLKNELEKAMVITVDYDEPLTVGTDASDIALAAFLTQNGRPVAFFSRTLNTSEKHHSAVEKEAYAIVESIRKWRHYLLGRHFKLITDQRSISFMFDNQQQRKIKNDKIQRWRIELSQFTYDIIYRPGQDNHVADALSRNVCANVNPLSKLKQLHESLCHPGITRLVHFVRTKNLPFSVDNVKEVTSSCKVCCELKPKFAKFSGQLIKATQPFERLSVDFKGPLPSVSRNRYLLTIIDEYSRFPFAFACPDTSSSTVIDRLSQVFALFGTPGYIHSDRGSSFLSDDVKKFLLEKGVASSHTTAYNPQGNGQVERLNGTLWKSICLSLRTTNLPLNRWESVLHDVLHSLRSLLCTATNCTPHERMFRYARRSINGVSLPSWLTVPGPVLLKRCDRNSKYEQLVEEVELIQCNPQYARILHTDGRSETVSLRRLAQLPEQENRNLVTDHPSTSDPEQPLDSEIESSPPVPDSLQDAHSDLLEKQQRTRPYTLRNREA